jgi:hypothetical protein
VGAAAEAGQRACQRVRPAAVLPLRPVVRTVWLSWFVRPRPVLLRPPVPSTRMTKHWAPRFCPCSVPRRIRLRSASELTPNPCAAKAIGSSSASGRGRAGRSHQTRLRPDAAGRPRGWWPAASRQISSVRYGVNRRSIPHQRHVAGWSLACGGRRQRCDSPAGAAGQWGCAVLIVMARPRRSHSSTYLV